MRKPDYDRRVVVTGLGVISPVGNDVTTVWDNLIHGVSGLAELTRFDVSRYEHKWGGEVKDFNATDWMDPKHARRTESSVHFGVAAAKQALADSGPRDHRREPRGGRRHLQLRRRRPGADDRQLDLAPRARARGPSRRRSSPTPSSTRPPG